MQERPSHGGPRERVSYDRQRPVIAAGIWDAAPLEPPRAAEAGRWVDGHGAYSWWMTQPVRSLMPSLGAAPQDVIALGRCADGQTIVSLTPAAKCPSLLG